MSTKARVQVTIDVEQTKQFARYWWERNFNDILFQQHLLSIEKDENLLQAIDNLRKYLNDLDLCLQDCQEIVIGGEQWKLQELQQPKKEGV